MLELFVFLIVLTIIRSWRRSRPEPQRSARIDIYHHWSGGGPGERRPEEPPLLLDRVADNVVPLRRRVQ